MRRLTAAATAAGLAALLFLGACSASNGSSGPPDEAARGVAGDGVTVEGRITAEGVECPGLRTDDDRLYTLAGAPEDLQPGQRVVVHGTLAEISFCMQGTTISVERVEPR